VSKFWEFSRYFAYTNANNNAIKMYFRELWQFKRHKLLVGIVYAQFIEH